MSQTTMPMRHDAARAGQDSEAGTRRVRSLVAEGAVPFGYGLVGGTDKTKQAKLPNTNTGIFAGVAMLTLAQESAPSGDTALPGYADKRTMNVQVGGANWVVLETSDTAAAGDTLYMIPSGTAAGRFSNAASITSVANIVTGLKVRRTFTESDPVSRKIAEAVFTTDAS